MELPAGYRLRAPTLGDLDAVADVLIADEFDEAGQIVLGVGFVRDEWSRVGFDLATDAWVVAGGAGRSSATRRLCGRSRVSLSPGGSSTPGTVGAASVPFC
jgi:hypothetical protein